MVHRLNRMLVMAAIAFIGTALISAAATAQTCIVVNGQKVWVDENTYPATNTTGSVDFESPTPIPVTGQLNESLTILQLNANSNDPVLGPVTTSLTPGATGAATIVSDPSGRFPAAVTITFNGTALLPARSPLPYTSTTPLVLTGTVNSFPFVGETLTLTNDVIFQDTNGGEITLKSGSSVQVNGQP